VVFVAITAPLERKASDEIVPSLSLAVAVRLTVAGAVKVAPFAGAVSETTGFASTVTGMAVEVTVRPRLSYAFAVSE